LQLLTCSPPIFYFYSVSQRERNISKAGDPALEEEQKLRKRVTKGAWGIAKDKANIHLSMEKVQSYEEVSPVINHLLASTQL
jgi:hypothetical protein